jgi:flagellar protein FliO/FliZ
VLELVIRVVVSLAVVLGLFWVFARTSAKRLGGRERGMMRVRSRQALSRGASLAVVEVGSRTLVVGVSDSGGVRLLTELEEDAAPAEEVPAAPPVAQPAPLTQPVQQPAAFVGRTVPVPARRPHQQTGRQTGHAVVPAGSPLAGRSVAELAMERLAAFAAADQTVGHGHTPAPGTAFAPARFAHVTATSPRPDMPGAPTPVTGASGLVGFVGAPGALPVSRPVVQPEARTRLSVVPSAAEPAAHVDSVVARVLDETSVPVSVQGVQEVQPAVPAPPDDDSPLAGSLLSAATWRQAWTAATKRFPQTQQPPQQPMEPTVADGDVA